MPVFFNAYDRCNLTEGDCDDVLPDRMTCAFVCAYRHSPPQTQLV